MNNPPSDLARFVTCPCQHCNGGIEFDASHTGESAACPHCGLDTMLLSPMPQEFRQLSLPQNVSVELKRGVNPLGIASLVLGIGACVLCWIPFLGLVVIPIAAIGLLLAVIGITAAIVGKKSSFSFPVSGGIVCLLSIFIAVATTGGVSKIISSNFAQINLSDWTKTASAKTDDVQVTIETISMGQVESYLDGINSKTSVPYQQIYLSVLNLSNSKKLDFETWRGGATLSDNFGNSYKSIDFPMGIYHMGTNNFNHVYQSDGTLIPNQGTIYPGQSFDDLLLFQVPVNGYHWLHLELPAENFGGSGVIRFEIPANR